MDEWIWELGPCGECADPAQGTERNRPRTEEGQKQPALYPETRLQPADSTHRLVALHIAVVNIDRVRSSLRPQFRSQRLADRY